eukprot:1026266-Prymnesium_polylepis.1
MVAQLAAEHEAYACEDIMSRELSPRALVLAVAPMGGLRDAWHARLEVTIQPKRRCDVQLGQSFGLRGGIKLASTSNRLPGGYPDPADPNQQPTGFLAAVIAGGPLRSP